MAKPSLRLRISAIAGVIFGLAVVGGGVALTAQLQASLVSGVQASAERDAEVIQDSPAPPPWEDDDRFYQIVARDGSVVAASDDAPNRAIPIDGENPRTETVEGDDADYLVVLEEADDGNTIVVGHSLETVSEATDAVSQLLQVAVPVLIGMVFLILWIVVGRALRPVERMRREVDAVTAARLHQRVDDPGTNDEIGRLAQTMNRMLDRLASSQEAQRRFVSDASHELKSPLASLRQYAEVAQRYPDRVTSAELSEAVLDEGARLERLVQNMLVLAHADEGSVIAEPVDLDDIVLSEAARLRSTTGLAVDSAAVGPARVLGDPALLAQLVRNLVDNAARHASSTVALSLEDGLLAIEDDGPGIPEPERERVFERFVRLDEGRARDAGGSGLGLAIVRELAAAHGGAVVVVPGRLGGARFEVRLPAASGS